MSSIAKPHPISPRTQRHLQILQELQDKGMDIVRTLHASRMTPGTADAFARAVRSICECIVLETRIREAARRHPPAPPPPLLLEDDAPIPHGLLN